MSRALKDVRIADFTQMMQGPWATQKLADLGADVIKIERIGGEWERKLGAAGKLMDGESPFFLAMNRNKRSVTLDLKHDEGREVALDIVAEADVMVENFRPGVMDRLGLGYEDVQEVNEDIIYVSGSGFGSDGPYVERPGQDLLLQAMSGLARYTGQKDDPPTPVGTAIVDEHSATTIAMNTLAALFYREISGEGQKVEANLLNAAIDFQCQEITTVLNMDEEFERSEEGIAQAWLGAPYGIYETEDSYMAIAMTPMETIAEATSIDEFNEYADERDAYENRDYLKRRLEEYTRQHSTEDLLEKFLEYDIWVAEVNDFHDVVEDPQVDHNDMIIEVKSPSGQTFETTGIPVELSKTPGEVRTGVPGAGEHSEEILVNHGYSQAEIDELVAEGVTSRPEE